MNQKQFDKSLGERIYRARVLDRKTQVWLAKKLGISQPHLSKVERGKATLGMHQALRLLADEVRQPLEVTLERL